LVALLCLGAHGSQDAVNPIRKVVTMLQMMQNKVTAEGEKEKELFEKYMCYCKNSGGDLDKSIADAKVKMPELASDIEAAEAEKKQLAADVEQAKLDRTAAKASMAEATAIREKEAAAFAAETADQKTNIAAMGKAIAALEKGMTGSFLQTAAASTIKQLVTKSHDLIDADRDEVLAFLTTSSSSQYAPQSGEITGILKQMKETMEKSLAKAEADEAAAIKIYEELMAAKTKEVNALTAAIEEKLVRIGELGVKIVDMKEDLSDTEKALIEDTKFLEDLKKNCATKEAEWAVVCKTRAAELVALSETIKLLNDDDALELFKKTLPTPAASLMQVQVTSASVKARALALVEEAKKRHGSVNLDLLSMALKGKKVSFDKVITMIDDMVALLKKEQVDDDDKKAYCITEFDTLDDKKKALERSISDLEAAISDAEGTIDTLTNEIKALIDGIAALDKAVAEATEQRKTEHADYLDLKASDTAAKELLGLAKNRLNKFYNPKMYKEAPKRVLSEEERLTVNMGGTLAPTNPPAGISGTGIAVFAQISSHEQDKVAPPPPPAAVPAYTKKSEESTGVIGMIDLLIKDLDKELTEAETTEVDAQADYEQLMKDSAEKRVADSTSLSEKEATKADTEVKLITLKETKKGTTKELASTLEVIAATHAECDWLLKYFDVRKEARTGEIDSLVKAKAVLSGADYSLVQTSSRSLRGH